MHIDRLGMCVSGRSVDEKSEMKMKQKEEITKKKKGKKVNALYQRCAIWNVCGCEMRAARGVRGRSVKCQKKETTYAKSINMHIVCVASFVRFWFGTF